VIHVYSSDLIPPKGYAVGTSKAGINGVPPADLEKAISISF
jgi:hypothetical protein